MHIIEIPEKHALVELSATEIRALWKALHRIRDQMDAKEFLYDFEMTSEMAGQLAHRLSDALDLAQRNVRDE
jgi:hypothetical protein